MSKWKKNSRLESTPIKLMFFSSKYYVMGDVSMFWKLTYMPLNKLWDIYLSFVIVNSKVGDVFHRGYMFTGATLQTEYSTHHERTRWNKILKVPQNYLFIRLEDRLLAQCSLGRSPTKSCLSTYSLQVLFERCLALRCVACFRNATH